MSWSETGWPVATCGPGRRQRCTSGTAVRFAGTCPELAWLIGEPLIDANGDYLPDLQFLRLVVGSGRELQTSLRDVRAIELVAT